MAEITYRVTTGRHGYLKNKTLPEVMDFVEKVLEDREKKVTIERETLEVVRKYEKKSITEELLGR